ALRREGPPGRDPAQRPGVRGAELQPVGDDLRPGLAGSDQLLRGSTGDRGTRGTSGRARMSKARGGLGRGLGALIPTATPAPPTRVPAADGVTGVDAFPDLDGSLSPVPGARFAEVAVDSIVPNPKQPRTVFDEEALAELKSSINEVGFLQPIVVRETGSQQY